MIIIENMMLTEQVHNHHYMRKYSNYNINKFQEMISYESWDDVFKNDNANLNCTFNAFLNTYLRIFYSCFTKRIISKPKYNPWITRGIRTSCENKRKLYLTYRQDDNPYFKLYYLKYCKVLAEVIKETKKVYYVNKITKSHNKIKTTWSIIKRETGNKNHKSEPQSLKINNTLIKATKHIANAFNEYFISAQTITDNLNKDNNKTSINTNPYIIWTIST
jgi:hypothetical protein